MAPFPSRPTLLAAASSLVQHGLDQPGVSHSGHEPNHWSRRLACDQQSIDSMECIVFDDSIFAPETQPIRSEIELGAVIVQDVHNDCYSGLARLNVSFLAICSVVFKEVILVS